MEISHFPIAVQPFLRNHKVTLDDVGCSDASVYRIEGTDENFYLKVQAACQETENSEKMMKWLNGKLPVPQLKMYIRDKGKDYLLTSELAGVPAFKKKTDDDLIRILAQGLKSFQQLSIANCPVINNNTEKFKRIEEHNRSGKNSDWNTILHDLKAGHVRHCDFIERFSSAEELLSWLIAHCPEEELVVSHGDYCLPNIYLDKGCISGFIDLGSGGVACRWHDIATCSWSLGYNLGDGEWAFRLCRELGIEPDWEKITFYTLLERLG